MWEEPIKGSSKHLKQPGRMSRVFIYFAMCQVHFINESQNHKCFSEGVTASTLVPLVFLLIDVTCLNKKNEKGTSFLPFFLCPCYNLPLPSFIKIRTVFFFYMWNTGNLCIFRPLKILQIKPFKKEKSLWLHRFKLFAALRQREKGFIFLTESTVKTCL